MARVVADPPLQLGPNDTSSQNRGLSTLSTEDAWPRKRRVRPPEGYRALTPHLIFGSASQAIDWYTNAMGMEEKARSVGPDGKIIHAEMQIGNSRFMLNDAMGGGKTPKAYGCSPINLWVYVDDCDALFTRATGAGAQLAPGPLGQLQDQFWGDRSGTFTDPFGYQWTVATRKEDVPREEMDRRAQAFFKKMAQPTHA